MSCLFGRSLFRRIGFMGCTAICLFMIPAPAVATNILFVKPGEEGATQERAAVFLTDFSSYLGRHVPFLKGETVTGFIANSHHQGASLLTSKKPLVAFVSAGFYLAYLQEKGIPVAQMSRFEANSDKYYLVGAKIGPDTIGELEAKTVFTTFSIDWSYLKSVVFPNDYCPGAFFNLKPANNMADEVFLLTEPDMSQSSADALLMDQDMLFFFKQDTMAWPKLKVIWESGDLPPGLAVLVGQHVSRYVTELMDVLLNMDQDEQGKNLLRLMSSNGFKEVEKHLLDSAKLKYQTAGACD